MMSNAPFKTSVSFLRILISEQDPDDTFHLLCPESQYMKRPTYPYAPGHCQSRHGLHVEHSPLHRHLQVQLQLKMALLTELLQA